MKYDKHAPLADPAWTALVPVKVARDQRTWERLRYAERARDVGGLTFAELGRKLKVGTERARQIYERAKRRFRRGTISPVEQYMAGLVADLHAIASFRPKVRYSHYRWHSGATNLKQFPPAGSFAGLVM